MTRKAIGILTSGGDCPGLNAAIRGVGKTARDYYGMQVIGFQDGFRGLVENRTVRLEGDVLSGIIASGGTILGTSRDKPQRMPVGNDTYIDMTEVAIANYHKNHLDALICLGGGGTQKNALRLAKRGLNIITLPKTIDNDVAETDVTFGFDTAMTIAAEAIDRLHTTADSHHRVIVVEIMGHNAGWLALGAGLAGGADVILIPEIPYRIDAVVEALLARSRAGKRFSIIAMAEGALSFEEVERRAAALVPVAETAEAGSDAKEAKGGKAAAKAAKLAGDGRGVKDYHEDPEAVTGIREVGLQLAVDLSKRSGLEARVTALGHLQRGGTPTPADRILATRLGTASVELVRDGVFGVMAAVKCDGWQAVPLEQVAGKLRTVPPDHPWVRSARLVGTSLGD
jgi:ATP-dependent phosphofructokinase / diphosphate-dependent phosphofructokinase